MNIDLHVDNIRCGGCANTITKALTKIGAQDIQIDVEHGRIHFNAVSDLRASAQTVLSGLGYPAAGTQTGINGLAAKAKSLASCAVGKFS